MKAEFLQNRLDSWPEHKVLEMLLFYALPRADVNPLAHKLINHFGSLAGVLNASADDLMKLPQIGEHTATLLSLIPQVCRRYMMSQNAFDYIIDSSAKAGRYLIPRFVNERDEVLLLVCLDAKRKILNCREIGRGSTNSTSVNIRKIIEVALSHNSTSVVLSHNHTSGIALPSAEDEIATRQIYSALKIVSIELFDHIIIANDDFVSMAENGFFKSI